MKKRTTALLHIGNLADGFLLFKQKFPDFKQAVVITDENTHRYCLPILKNCTDWKNAPVFDIPSGELHKNLDTCRHLWQQMLDHQLDRQTLVVLLGGGVVGDLGGFCAATFKRGLPFVQVPTTLLAMTDAAIGGKLGIDFQGVKNMVGVFQQPKAVLCDPIFLKTLPPRELTNGMAEVIKHAFIGSPTLLRHLKKMQNLPDTSDPVWFEILKKSVAVKQKVVRFDPQERLGLRALLNFGHTIGHALETFFLNRNNPLLHGEAVAVGMICETFIQQEAEARSVAELIFRFFPKIEIPDTALPVLLEIMKNDKKNLSNKILMTLPTDGQLGYEMLAPTAEDVRTAIDFYRQLSPRY